MADRSHPTIWFVDLDASADDLARARALLSPDEIRQADAYRHPEVRYQYVAAHAALRLILARLVDQAPAKLRFDRATCPLCGEPHGRPRLDPVQTAPGPGTSVLPHFSLTRRPCLAAVAVADRPIGVDLEAVDRGIGVNDLAAALHPREKEHVDRLRSEERRAAALRFWTRTEAYLKALGTGLGLGPSSVDTTRPLLPTPVGLDLDLADGTPSTWMLHDLPVDSPARVAAVAVEADAVNVPPTIMHTALPALF